MLETERRSLRRKTPAPNHRLRPPQPQQSPSPRRQRAVEPRRSSRPSRPIEILSRCNSEPTLLAAGVDEHRNMTAPEAVMYRPQTCMDIFSSPDYLIPQSPAKFQGYSKEAKVVINVTVEGSPGPIRTMVKLGSSVEDTIRLVIAKYSQQGRTPLLPQDAAAFFELHPSYFSLQSLNKSEMIGDVGSRSFYLRKVNNYGSNSEGETASASFSSENIIERENHPVSTVTPLAFFFPTFFARKINKIIRRARKLWKILGCMHCSG